MKKILVVADEESQRKELARSLNSNKFAVEEAVSGEDALDMIRTSDFDLVLLEHVMPQMNGMDVLSRIKKMKPGMPVIMLTGFASIDDAVEAVKKGANNYLSRPFEMDKLFLSIQQALEESKLQASTSMADLDVTFGSLSHRIRRNIITLLHHNRKMYLMEMVRSLDIEDHTKVVFHTRILKEAGIIQQEKDKSYFLTEDGEKLSHVIHQSIISFSANSNKIIN